MILNNIHDWVNELIIPKKELDGLPICPYAKQALSLYSIEECNFENIEDKLSKCDILNHKVCIFYFKEYHTYDTVILEERTKALNDQFKSKDLIILDNDPRSPFIINNVKTTFDGCYLWLAQSLSDLNIKSKELERKTSYYTFWTKGQLDDVVNWR
jgi:hypothetical protein